MAQSVGHRTSKLRRMLSRAGYGYLYRPVLIAVIVICVAVAVLALVSFWPRSDESEQRFTAGESVSVASAEVKEETILVDVEGSVTSPGVYKLPKGSRVKDGVDAAGGASEAGDTSTVNLARLLSDGERLYIPSHEEVQSSTVVGAVAGTAAGQSLVNINTATVEQLCELPGIGEVTAQRIVADRTANGPFTTVDDLLRVSGIGEKKFEAIEGAICV